MELQILEVSQVNAYIKGLFDRDALLGQVCVQGELSNYKIYPSGHHYFTMKDAEGALRCVMFRSSAGRLRFKPENGMQVLAVGRITVFPRDGAYQLYCENLTPAGAGDLHVAFEQLKAKLLAEGLFDRSAEKTAAAVSAHDRHYHVRRGRGDHGYAADLEQALSAGEGQNFAGARTGRGGPGGDRGRDPLCQRAQGSRCAHYRARRRIDGGSLGVQR